MAQRVRVAGEDDIPVLTLLIRESFGDVAVRFGLTVENCPSHPSNYTKDWCRREMEKGARFFILEDDGQPCGCVAMEHPKPDVCYLERLAVLPWCRRRGYGRLLTDHVIGEAKRLGARRVSVAIIAEHHELRDWYERTGFRRTKTEGYSHLPFEVMFLEKTT